MATQSVSSRGVRSIVGWLLGLFALWQLIFPVLANVLEFVPIRPSAGVQTPPLESTQRWGRFTSNESLQTTLECIGYGVAWYAQITGQEQGWDMFTPGFPAYTVVPFAELDLPEGQTVRVDSRFDPCKFRQPWIRPPFVYDREFNYEANLFMIAWHWDPERPPTGKDLPQKVRDNEELLMRWLRWHSQRRSDAIEIRLMLRYLPIPCETTERPTEVPFARWRPQATPPVGKLPLEAFDPIQKRFISLDNWDEQP